MTQTIDDAKKKAQQVLDDNFVVEPPVRVTDIAANYGLQIAVADLGEYGADVAGYIDPKAKLIVVNMNDPSTRQAFTIAHELGHWFMHQDKLESEPDKYAILYRKPLGGPNIDSIEKQANTFAACLLVPKSMLENYKDTSDYRTIADIFGVSQEVIGYRFRHEFGKQESADDVN
jgi:Zn-dependent peptidase ImmA (M78 family)